MVDPVRQMLVQDDTPPEEAPPSPQPQEPAKITARMRRIRELIELGQYPDRDELAERIVDCGVELPGESPPPEGDDEPLT
jgi:hypothetical protein